MSDTLSRVNYETSTSAVGVEGHDGLDSDIHVFYFEFLEHSDERLLFVLSGGSKIISYDDTLNIARSDSEFFIKCVIPDLLHVFPVLDNSVLNGVLQVEDGSLLLGLIADVLGLLGHTLHDTSVLGAADD